MWLELGLPCGIVQRAIWLLPTNGEGMLCPQLSQTFATCILLPMVLYVWVSERTP